MDTSHPLTTQQARHEEYMKCTAAELTRILGINQIAVPSKSKTKDRLAWQCVYGEALGAPVGHCPRCLHGKLKPKLKEEEWGMKVAKGTVKVRQRVHKEADDERRLRQNQSALGAETALHKGSHTHRHRPRKANVKQHA